MTAVNTVVTGGASGIGRAVAALLKDMGYRVIVWDICGGDLECDISDPDAVSAGMAAIVAEHGVPARVVACAGVGASGLLLSRSVTDSQRVIAVNLTGTWLTLRAGAQAMIDAGVPGSMVAVSSISGTVADRDMGACCVSKAGIDMLVKVAAVQWGRFGIRVTVGPGVTRTPMLSQAGKLWIAALSERTALGRLGKPTDVAAAIVGVLELDWVTGQVVHADGGLAVHSPIDAYGQLRRLAASRPPDTD